MSIKRYKSHENLKGGSKIIFAVNIIVYRGNLQEHTKIKISN